MTLPGRVAKGAVLLLACLILSGCFSFERDETFAVKIDTTTWGAPDATIPIFRRATLRLRQHYRNDLLKPDGSPLGCSQSSWRTKVTCVRNDLKLAEDKMPDVKALKDRWHAALADDQLSDLNTAVLDSASSGTCLTLYARIGLGDIGYNWTKRSSGDDGCRRGLDPTPALLPSID